MIVRWEKKRYLEGRIFITNNRLFSNDGFNKGNRRVVVLNNDKSEAVICKIKSLKDKEGNLRQKLIPIERYPCLTKPSGVDPNLRKRTNKGKINLQKMQPTAGRLNKCDMKKVKEKIKKCPITFYRAG